jgi:hypothetical protein
MPKFRRVWAMPNRHTFLIKPIREEIESVISGLGGHNDTIVTFETKVVT